jgi:hypothetical protein
MATSNNSNTLPTLPATKKLATYEANFYQAMGRAVIAWNNADTAMRILLNEMCGDSTASHLMRTAVLTSELGSVSLTNALRSLSDAIFPPNASAAVAHAVDYFERGLAFRNYYVHGIHKAEERTGKTGGVVGTISAKTKLKAHQDFIPVEALEALAAHASAIENYADALKMWFRSPLDTAGSTLPRKPPLPDKLEKPHQHLRELFLQRIKAREKSLPSK